MNPFAISIPISLLGSLYAIRLRKYSWIPENLSDKNSPFKLRLQVVTVHGLSGSELRSEERRVGKEC